MSTTQQFPEASAAGHGADEHATANQETAVPPGESPTVAALAPAEPAEPEPEAEAKGKRPISARKLAANRANAQRSTGPRTAEGKEKSKLNATTHGLTARYFPGVIQAGTAEWQEFE